MTNIDPVGAFQRARMNRLQIEGAEQKLAQQPQRNRLLDLQLQKAEQDLLPKPIDPIAQSAEMRKQKAFDVDLATKQAAFLNQTARAFKQLDPSQWNAAAQRLGPQAEALGIPIEQLGPITPESLDEIIAATQGFIGETGLPTSVREAQFAFPGDVDRQRAAVGQKMTKPLSTTNVIQEAEKAGMTAEQKKAGELRVKRFEGMQNDAQNAIDQNERLDQIQNISVNTGFGEQFKVNVARAFNALGVDGDDLLGVDVANMQAFNSISGKLVLDTMEAQKGPQTDQDAARIEKTLPSIENEDLANDFIIRSMRAINDRKIEQAIFYERFFDKEKTLKGADRAWREFKRTTPMVSETVKDKQTGLPMFFNDFMSKARGQAPDLTDDQLIEEWRRLTGGK